jgi:hypothetical protein
MNHSSCQPRLSGEGIVFTVIVDCVRHECMVTSQALFSLSSSEIQNTENDMLEIFRAHEPSINGIARRLVAAGVAGNPLVLRPETFRPPRAR